MAKLVDLTNLVPQREINMVRQAAQNQQPPRTVNSGGGGGCCSSCSGSAPRI